MAADLPMANISISTVLIFAFIWCWRTLSCAAVGGRELSAHRTHTCHSGVIGPSSNAVAEDSCRMDVDSIGGTGMRTQRRLSSVGGSSGDESTSADSWLDWGVEVRISNAARTPDDLGQCRM
jgi:hypothetical protein